MVKFKRAPTRDERMDILFDKLMTPLILSMLLVMLAAVKWGRYYFPSPSPDRDNLVKGNKSLQMTL
jgi:hypothetical protein